MSNSPIIDYPGNLHYFLGVLLAKPGISNFIWALAGYIFLGILILLSLCKLTCRNIPSNKYKRLLLSSFFFSLVIAAGILALRLPNLLLFEQNPDESQWMTGAATLLKDPRFWVSVNGGTSGPLVIYPLSLIKIFGGSINYTTTRLFGLLFCIVPSVLFLYFAFINFFSDRVARFIIMPLAVCLAFANHADIIAYSSEYVPMLLFSLSIFLYSTIVRKPSSAPSFLFTFGVILGSIPFSKIQAAPIAAVMGITCLLTFIRNKFNLKQLLFFSLGGILPTCIVLAYLFSLRIFYDFWQSYIIFNVSYAKGLLPGTISSTPLKFLGFLFFIFLVSDTTCYFISLLLIIGATGCAILKDWNAFSNSSRQLITLSFLMTMTACYVIIQPGNFFPHYQLLLIVPVLFFAGSLIGAVFEHSSRANDDCLVKNFIVGFTISSALLISLNLLNGSAGLRYLKYAGIGKYKTEITEKVKEYAEPNESMAVWGWMDKYYILTGLLQGTKDPHSSIQIMKGKQQDYFLKRYASDLLNNKPVIFLDAVSSNSFAFDKAECRFENYPQVRTIIDRNYTFTAEFDGIRLFIRNDRYAEKRETK